MTANGPWFNTRYGRSDFGVNAERIRDYLTALRAAATVQG
jgi:hypothetical protein